jgi:hypothetical protein
LLSQAYQLDRVAISVPFDGEVVRIVLNILASGDEDCNGIDKRGFHAARELGIMFIIEGLPKLKGFGG